MRQAYSTKIMPQLLNLSTNHAFQTLAVSFSAEMKICFENTKITAGI
jgi:hypothetical protein